MTISAIKPDELDVAASFESILFAPGATPVGIEEDEADRALFLRAERAEDGTRTFRLIEAPPLSTNFGEDVYRRVFA